jgi:acetyl-CoA C-acetyltransferase
MRSAWEQHALHRGKPLLVIAGGVEAWSRSPIRLTRPHHVGEAAVAYERPPFAPDPAQDPDLLLSAARYAAQHGLRAYNKTRMPYKATNALCHTAPTWRMRSCQSVMYFTTPDPRSITSERAARMPIAAHTDAQGAVNADAFRAADAQAQELDCSISRLGVSAKADGAAFVLLLSAQACEQLGIQAQAQWLSSSSAGCAPDTPLLAAQHAAEQALQRAHISDGRSLQAIELHDAFAVQGLSFAQALGISPDRLNPRGGGLARGHPIGASGAVALVRLLANLALDGSAGA